LWIPNDTPMTNGLTDTNEATGGKALAHQCFATCGTWLLLKGHAKNVGCKTSSTNAKMNLDMGTVRKGPSSNAFVLPHRDLYLRLKCLKNCSQPGIILSNTPQWRDRSPPNISSPLAEVGASSSHPPPFGCKQEAAQKQDLGSVGR